MPVLHVHRYGPADGAPVLALHGVQSHGERFRLLAEERLTSHRVVAPDLRGHGRSTWAPPWNLEQHVDDLLATVEDEGLDRFAVVGHTFGRLLGLRLAARVPERVTHLALLDPALALEPDVALASAESAARDDGWATLDEARAARLDGRPPQSLPMAEEDLRQALERSDDGRFRLRWCRPAAATAWGEMARPLATAAAVPTLLAWATRERFVRPPILERLRADLGPLLVEQPIDAGHMLLWDAFEPTAGAVADFLRR